MTDTNKLKGYIVSNGYTQNGIAEMLNISEQSLSSKINNKADFRQCEMQKLIDLLQIESPTAIFLLLMFS